MTYTEVQDKIILNLADFSNIVPEKHREVEQMLLDYIEQNLPLYRGSFIIGDISGSDQIFNITFPSVGTSEYYVIGSIKSNSSNYDADNDVIWVWREPTTVGFKIALREVSGNIQNLTFYYEIKKI
jgi:hypothetical protein